MPRQGRRIPVDASLDLVGRLLTIEPPLVDALRTAAANYAQALNSWYLGGELVALASLYVASESLDKACVITEAADAGRTPEELAHDLGMGLRNLYAKRRRETVFRNDLETYDLAKDAIDGYEHGSMPLGEAHRRATEACPKAFRYIRERLIELSGVEKATFEKLTTGTYAEPLDALSTRTLIRGEFQGVGAVLAAPNEMYPIIRWNRSLDRLELSEDRQLEASIKEQMQISCADGVNFAGRTVEVHGRLGQESQAPRNMKVQKLKFTPPGDDSPAEPSDG
jgi:hypothetical protein